MTSLNQMETVKQMLSEGWETAPSQDKSMFGGPATLQRTRDDGSVEQVSVLPDGTVKNGL